MKRSLRNRSLSTITFYSTLAVSIVLGVMVAAIFIFFEVREFNKDAEKAREESLVEKKRKVKSEVEKVIDYIHFTRLFMEKRMQEDLRERTYEAWSIINHIYSKNKGRVSDNQILKRIKEALRPIRFNNGRGYYFIVNLNGVEQLYPIHPEFEGQNLLNLKDAKGNYVIRDEIKLAKGQGEGFVKGYWRKPEVNQDRMYAKTSFIKVFKPLNIYVGCGDYLEDVRKDVQKDVKRRIKRNRFGEMGYVFVNTYNGVAVVIDSDQFTEGDTIWEMTDPNGVKVIQEEWKAVNRPGGGFIEYHWEKPGTSEIAPKISFIKGVDEWQWMIGAGIYIDEIEKKIASEKELLYERMLRKGLLGILIVVLVILIVFVLARRISKKIQSNFEVFITNLRIAVRTGRLMDRAEYTIADLQDVLPPINEIIQTKAHTEEKLKESELRFRTIFENLPVMLVVFDENGKNKFHNKQFDKVFNIAKTQLVSKFTLGRFVDNNEENKGCLVDLAECNGVFRTFNVKTFAGHKIQNWACFKTGHNEQTFVGIDITPLKEQQKMLEESNSTKDKVLSVLSHDLHGPFNTLIGFSKILLSGSDKLGEAKTRRYLQHIHNSSKSMHTMLTNLLSWARAQSGEIKHYITVVDVYLLTQEVVRTLLPLAEEKSIAINNNIEPGLTLRTDASMLRIVIQNLVANGIKFTAGGGEVVVSSKMYDEDTVRIFVKDTGIGMEDEMVKKFNQGEKVNSTSGTNNESGTGLGLQICREFASHLNGSVYVQSEKGKGTTFYVTLPLRIK